MNAIKLILLFISAPLFGQQLGFAVEQINGQAILDAGLTGKGVKVGVIDGGFLRADKSSSLAHLFENDQIAAYKDYLDPKAEDYSGKRAFDDVHGTEVLQLIAGYNKERDIQYGLATGATYYLARTDHGGYEKRTEEKLAIKAMEWMAKEGVKVINLSLGYNFGYTNKRENYSKSQMDGKSTILTKAVEKLSAKYGILVIVAAGNDGNNSWKILGSPGDAKSVLTVGATNLKIWDNMNYTSKGPEWLDYVKPELSCYATTGTSFSTPVITGLAACLLEQNPELSGEELKQLLINSAQLSRPNNLTGFGVPDAQLALNKINKESVLIKPDKNSYLLELEEPSAYVSIFHLSGWEVLEKEVNRSKKTKIRVKRKEGSDGATVFWKGGSLELLWPK